MKLFFFQNSPCTEPRAQYLAEATVQSWGLGPKGRRLQVSQKSATVRSVSVVDSVIRLAISFECFFFVGCMVV